MHQPRLGTPTLAKWRLYCYDEYWNGWLSLSMLYKRHIICASEGRGDTVDMINCSLIHCNFPTVVGIFVQKNVILWLWTLQYGSYKVIKFHNFNKKNQHFLSITWQTFHMENAVYKYRFPIFFRFRGNHTSVSVKQTWRTRVNETSIIIYDNDYCYLFIKIS